MFPTLAETFDAVHDRIDPRVTTPEALLRARGLLGTLPAALSDWIYLELPLWPCTPRADLIIRVDRVHCDALAALAADRASDSYARVQARWARVCAFVREWARESSLLAGAVDSLWLEFDLDVEDAAPVPPRFFVDLTRTVRRTGDAALWARVARDALAPLLSRPLAPDVGDHLRQCLNGLPAGASLLSLGVPHDNSADTVRVCTTGIADDDLQTYLHAIGWRGDGQAFADLFEPFRRATRRRQSVAILDLDLSAPGAGRLGLEIGFLRQPQRRGMVAEDHVLAALVRQHFVEPETLAGLLRWPGCSITHLRHVFGPSLLVRRLNHVKLVVEFDRVTAVKAYPCFFHRSRRAMASQLYSMDRALDIESLRAFDSRAT